MKNFIFLFILSGVLLSCNKNEDDNPLTSELKGEWNLISVRCLCEPINLEVGEHVWVFDLEQETLHVENNVTEKLHTILETGTYDIVVYENSITIQNIEYDFYFQNDRLYVANHPESDGPLIEYIKK